MGVLLNNKQQSVIRLESYFTENKPGLRFKFLCVLQTRKGRESEERLEITGGGPRQSRWIDRWNAIKNLGSDQMDK